MSDARDRMRERKTERQLDQLLGADPKYMPSLSRSSDLPAYAPRLEAPTLPNYAPSLTENAAQSSSAFTLRAPDMALAAPQQVQSTKAASKENWFTKELFGGIRTWQLMAISVGTVAIGVGAYKLATSSTPRSVRTRG